MPENDIQWKPIKTLYAYKNEERGGGYELRLGRWVVNGREGQPVLERRDWWENNQGQRMQGKQKGLDKGDLYRVFSAAAELSQIMGFPLPNWAAGAHEAKKSEEAKNEASNPPTSTGSRF